MLDVGQRTVQVDEEVEMRFVHEAVCTERRDERGSVGAVA